MAVAGEVANPNVQTTTANTTGLGAEQVVSQTKPVPVLTDAQLEAMRINQPIAVPDTIPTVSVPGLVDTYGNLTDATHQEYVNDLNRVVDRNMNDLRSSSVETNPYDFSTIPLGAEDIGSRFLRMGQTIGRARSEGYDDLSGGAKAANVVSGVASGLSGLLGVARNVMTGISSTIGANKDAQLAQQRLYQQRRDSQTQYAKEGGTYLGPGNEFSLRSLAGEYMYPLPKSMQESANVEVEKGEYVMRPGDTPKEALGQTHEKGGTPVSLETGTRVISDDLQIGSEFAKTMRDTYGIRVTPKDTYATVLDRYKTRIGLKAAYDDQRKALERLEKNDKIEDENTRRLNASVLSKAVNEADERIAGLEKRFKDFSDLVYDEQERQKDAEIESSYMAKGGEVDKALNEAQKKYGFSDEEMREIRARMIRGIKDKQMMANAGTVTNPLGRQLTMRIVANPNAQDAYGFQHMNSTGQYGVTTRDWMKDAISVMPLLGSYEDAIKMGNTPFGRKIENVYTGMNDAWRYLADNGFLTNAAAMNDFVKENRFLSDQEIDWDNVASRVRGMEGKTGEWHLSRPNVGFDVVNNDQYNALKEKGITYFSQLRGNEKVAKEILGEDYDKLMALGDMEGLRGLDFMILPYIPDNEMNPIENPGINPPEVNVDLSPISERVGAQPAAGTTTMRSGNTDTSNNRRRTTGAAPVNGSGLFFPEVWRMAPSNVVTEGLERFRAPQVDPVLRSADQYMTEASRSFQSQLDQLDQVPDSQRGAMMSNLQAILGSNIGNFINQVEQANVAARTDARNRNAVYWNTTEAQNAAERLRYQQSYLKGQAINEENWARYYDNVNQEQQQKWNARTSMNTLRSIFGDVMYSPDGRIIVNPRGDIVNMPSWAMTQSAGTPSETTTTTTTDSKGNTRRTTRTKIKNG